MGYGPISTSPPPAATVTADNAERAAITALGYNFLRRAIGWTL
jgi:hypothetical protein